ncbi:kinesin-like protein Klp5 [Kappamyces sp. JEL0680]|nr:kinesin-like protein Klp5 [Kappamyces sp. JEL0680]
MSHKDHIKVVVRIRPLLPHEQMANPSKNQRRISLVPEDRPQTTVRCLDAKILLYAAPNEKLKKEFTFDNVLDQKCSQEQVFEQTALPLVQHVLDGYHSTIFAYGATGCGKTHTITGTEQEPGLIYRTVQELYRRIEGMTEAIVEVGISYLEVYNETIRDLFKPGGKALDLREDDSHIHVAGLEELFPKDLSHVMRLLIKGNENRSKAPTAANATSSRSHAILQIHLRWDGRVLTG